MINLPLGEGEAVFGAREGLDQMGDVVLTQGGGQGIGQPVGDPAVMFGKRVVHLTLDLWGEQMRGVFLVRDDPDSVKRNIGRKAIREGAGDGRDEGPAHAVAHATHGPV